MRALLLALALCAGAGAAHAASASPPLCDRAAPMTAAQQDRLLRFAAIVKRELDASGADVALIARTGLDLQRFGVRYSHAGVSLKASGNAPWSVRQLYYACDERRPRLYDQGMAGFLSSTDDPSLGYVSILLLPRAHADALQHAALDDGRALRLLAAAYSANAYPFSLPAAIEAFVHRLFPAAERIELCHDERQIVIRRGWRALGEGYAAEAGDRVIGLE